MASKAPLMFQPPAYHMFVISFKVFRSSPSVGGLTDGIDAEGHRKFIAKEKGRVNK